MDHTKSLHADIKSVAGPEVPTKWGYKSPQNAPSLIILGFNKGILKQYPEFYLELYGKGYWLPKLVVRHR